MFIDARQVPNGTRIDADICIVGGGAAGITLARELADKSVKIALLESGGLELEERSQALYQGKQTGAHPLEIAASRLRYFGGTTNHWNGWCLPLDPIDFEVRDGLPYRGWPFDRAHLDPFYRRAQDICQIGAYDYDPAHWGVAKSRVPDPFNGPHFIGKLLQQSPPTRFAAVYGASLKQAANISVFLNANLLTFETDDAGATVGAAHVGTLDGGRFTVAAKIFVLAAGGIENARLLLLSNAQKAAGLGNENDQVGRFLMVHLEYRSGVIAVSNPYAYLEFNPPNDPRKPAQPFIGLSEATMRERRLPNIRVTWNYQMAPLPKGVAAMGGLLGKASADADRGILDNILSVMRDLHDVASYGWGRAVLGHGSPVDAVVQRCQSEQLPNPESRLTLADERDALDCNKVAVDWRLTADDRIHIDETHTLLASEIGRTGFGRMRYDLADEARWLDELRGNEHHMGTTRMHRDPKLGVVDEHCRVHSLANLYVAGSSVFPTSGAANPTLTIVALAVRLADRIKERLV